jgi:hypothetical protein
VLGEADATSSEASAALFFIQKLVKSFLVRCIKLLCIRECHF